MFSHGQQIEIHYPVSTHVRLWRPDRVCRRYLMVHSIRDLVAEPLSVEDFLRRPFLMRSRFLVKGYEPDHRRWRKFYVGSSNEFFAPGILRVGIYEPGARRPAELVGPEFKATPEDRRLLIRAVRRWSKYDIGDAKIGIFADDLRLFR